MILEMSTQLEFTFFTHRSYGSGNLLSGTRGRARYDLNAYGFFGIAGFYFNPKAQYNGTWYALQPLGTEGQGLPGNKGKYSLFQVSIPYGVGVYYTINRKLRIGYEMGMRQTFTDYLDDVSTVFADPVAIQNGNNSGTGDVAAALSNRSAEVLTEPLDLSNFGTVDKRGDPKHNDSYMFVQLKIGYALRAKRKPGKQGLTSFADIFKKSNKRKFGTRPKYKRR
jgi:hypothetical protein